MEELTVVASTDLINWLFSGQQCLFSFLMQV